MMWQSSLSNQALPQRLEMAGTREHGIGCLQLNAFQRTSYCSISKSSNPGFPGYPPPDRPGSQSHPPNEHLSACKMSPWMVHRCSNSCMTFGEWESGGIFQSVTPKLHSQIVPVGTQFEYLWGLHQVSGAGINLHFVAREAMHQRKLSQSILMSCPKMEWKLYNLEFFLQ